MACSFGCWSRLVGERSWHLIIIFFLVFDFFFVGGGGGNWQGKEKK